MISSHHWSSSAPRALTPLAPHEAVPEPNPSQLTPEDVIHSCAGRVYNLSRRLLGQDADAEDVTQEVLLQVVRKLHTFRGEAEIATWLHRVTVNAVLAHRRKAAYRPEFQTSAPLDSFASVGRTVSSDRAGAGCPGHAALDREGRQIIENAIGELPPIYRDVLVLADVEQLTNPEIAELLALSLPAVKSRLHRARQLMRTILSPYFTEISP